MDSESLRSLQAPLKQQYKDTPDAAVITLKATSVGSDGVTCKLDTAKGGAALSIAHITGRPIVMVGVGQNYEDLHPFDPDWLLEEMFR